MRMKFKESSTPQTLILPSSRNFYFIERDSSAAIFEVSSKEKPIKITDHKGRLVANLMPFEKKALILVKPKWYQFIKLIKGEKVWKIQ